jgi:hypothetical protein
MIGEDIFDLNERKLHTQVNGPFLHDLQTISSLLPHLLLPGPNFQEQGLK